MKHHIWLAAINIGTNYRVTKCSDFEDKNWNYTSSLNSLFFSTDPKFSHAGVITLSSIIWLIRKENNIKTTSSAHWLWPCVNQKRNDLLNLNLKYHLLPLPFFPFFETSFLIVFALRLKSFSSSLMFSSFLALERKIIDLNSW